MPKMTTFSILSRSLVFAFTIAIFIRPLLAQVHPASDYDVEPIHGNCSIFEQSEIRRCADPLYQIGAFQQSSDGVGFTWDFFAKQTKQYFSQVCDAFFIFDLCIEPYKLTCFTQEPIRSRYQTAMKILDFLCRDGYQEMLRNFDCFTKTLTRAEMMQCQAEMISDTRRIPDSNMVNGKEQEAAVCGAMRNYVDCVKYPIRYECGYRAWYVVREVIVRPTKLLMPQCDIASSATTLRINSFLLILPVLFVIVAYLSSGRNPASSI